MSVTNQPPVISRARLGDVEDILEFIQTDWRADHYFVKNPDFFLYHYRESDSALNFILARDQGVLIGILGFINNQVSGENADIVLSLWKVRKNADPSLGIKMLNFLQEQLKSASVSCTGINAKTIPIYKFLGFQTGRMNTYCLVNPNCCEFKILSGDVSKLVTAANSVVAKQTPGFFLKITDRDSLKSLLAKLKDASRPAKSLSYFYWRYFDHPVFKYTGYSLVKDEKTLIIFTRKIQSEYGDLLRIVDLYGDRDLLKFVTPHLLKILKDENIEYVELVVGGAFDDAILETGFVDVRLFDQLIMPLYFQPFVRNNIDIFYFTSLTANPVLFLGDGDQDRPN